MPEVQAAYRHAYAMLSALQLKSEAVSAPITSSAAVVVDAKAGAKGGKGTVTAPASTGDGLPASLEPFSSLLQDVSLTALTRLTALLEALQVRIPIIS